MKLDELISERERAAHKRGVYSGRKKMILPAFLLGVVTTTAVWFMFNTASSIKNLKAKDGLSTDLIKCYKDILKYEDIRQLERDAVESWEKKHGKETD